MTLIRSEWKLRMTSHWCCRHCHVRSLRTNFTASFRSSMYIVLTKLRHIFLFSYVRTNITFMKLNLSTYLMTFFLYESFNLVWETPVYEFRMCHLEIKTTTDYIFADLELAHVEYFGKFLSNLSLKRKLPSFSQLIDLDFDRWVCTTLHT